MNKQEILRYLEAGTAGNLLDSWIKRAETEVTSAASPRSVWREFSVTVRENSVFIGNSELVSKDLAQHLKGCKSAFLLALTLGPEIDTLIRRYSVTEMAMVPVLQACAAAYTEECADKLQLELESLAAERGLYLRPRFSPGYGDFPLNYQKFFFSVLDISKKIGVALNDNFMMIPFKSITAIVGLSADASLCHVGKCMDCNMENCPFRKADQQ